MELHENEEQVQKAFLVSVDTGEYDAQLSLLELIELTKSAGATVECTMTQKRTAINKATCIGSGRLIELENYCNENDIDLVIFDRELTPSQIRNIEQNMDARVIDRTMLILDIFAQRAISKEGKLQVELAQLKYLMPRLTGKGIALSRLGGGIGTRGPGETKLETDKRHIRRKMETIKEQMRDVQKHRNQIIKRREKDKVITVAIVGYTNAGKSTLMNYLTDANVLAENKLFATLDLTSRALKLPSGATVLLTDTVGLVRRLPHHLVDAFKSTLEQAASADVILNVCDASSDEAQLHLEVTRELLESLGAKESPIISVLNKCDLVNGINDTVMIGNAIRISAKDGQGIEELLNAIDDNLPIKIKKVNLLIPFDKTSVVAQIRKQGTILKEEYNENGTVIEALVEFDMLNQISQYLV